MKDKFIAFLKSRCCLKDFRKAYSMTHPRRHDTADVWLDSYLAKGEDPFYIIERAFPWDKTHRKPTLWENLSLIWQSILAGTPESDGTEVIPFAIIKQRVTTDLFLERQDKNWRWEWIRIQFRPRSFDHLAELKNHDIHIRQYPEEEYIDLTPQEARQLIADNGLVCVLENEDGQIYDTPDHAFQKDWETRPWRCGQFQTFDEMKWRGGFTREPNYKTK